MSSILRDLQLGLRTLIKSPALTAVSIIALTLGIGLTTMMFSIVYGALRKGLPFEDGDRIVATTAGDTLCYLHGAHPGPDGSPQPAVIVASEPFDDSDGWIDVPDNSVLLATADTATLETL